MSYKLKCERKPPHKRRGVKTVPGEYGRHLLPIFESWPGHPGRELQLHATKGWRPVARNE